MQVKQKNTFISSFGGLNFINDFLNSRGFSNLAGQHLGLRSLTAQYTYADLIKQLLFIASMGGDSLDESNDLKYQLQDHPHLKIASPDTIEYAFQELRQKTVNTTADSGACHQTNEHSGFNNLLAATCGKYLLPSTQSYMMDYDGHIIENTKADNCTTYKKTEGYYPVVCSINKFPVYMQNRNGNTPESYDQKKIIEAAFESCARQGISLNAFRADACCYEKSTLSFLEKRNIRYYIRAENSRRLLDALIDEPEWEPAMLGVRRIEVCSVQETILGKPRRVVAYRYKQKGQLTIDDVDGYRYYAIVTSDTTSTAVNCIETYNGRGCEGEHHFAELDYDFNWNKLPFDNMEMNTIYLYAMAVGYLLYNAVKNCYARKLSFVDSAMRMKAFILHFVTIPAKWIKTGRRWVLNLYTTRDYTPILNT